ncbi:MAG: hypothetical protein PHS77_06085 [Gallionellaceae bacterium]|jgi:hypothetical protein|nr:hypothetical protein [Gallionellaceae bacterium]
MAIGWLTVLKLVPWVDVISNAPKVVDGARKLWSSASGQPADVAADAAPAQPELAVRLVRVEREADALHAQMARSAELIKELADQNVRLIERVETLRARQNLLAAILALTGLLALAALLSVLYA